MQHFATYVPGNDDGEVASELQEPVDQLIVRCAVANERVYVVSDIADPRIQRVPACKRPPVLVAGSCWAFGFRPNLSPQRIPRLSFRRVFDKCWSLPKPLIFRVEATPGIEPG